MRKPSVRELQPSSVLKQPFIKIILFYNAHFDIKHTGDVVCFYNHSGLRTLYALAGKIKEEYFRKFVDMHLRLFVECVYSI